MDGCLAVGTSDKSNNSSQRIKPGTQKKKLVYEYININVFFCISYLSHYQSMRKDNDRTRERKGGRLLIRENEQLRESHLKVQ